MKLEEREVNEISIYPFSFYPEMIQWKLNYKESMEDDSVSRLSFSISVIVDIACLTEGVLYTVNKELFYNQVFPSVSLENRLLALLEKRLEKGQFNEYVDIYSIFIGKDLRELVGNELWKCIKVLFSFRNNLVHGNTIDIAEFRSAKGFRLDVNDNYRIVYQYLIEKNLTDVFSRDIDNLLFSDKVLLHFYNSAVDFIRVIVDNIPEHSQQHIRDMTKFITDAD